MRTAAALLALTAAVGCEGRAPPSAPPARRPATQSLLPALGQPTFIRLRDETRPAVLLQPGEERSCSVEAQPGRRLSFVWAVGPRSPAWGYVELQVSAGPDTIYRTKFSTARRHRWWPVSVPLSGRGPVKLTFRADHVHASGRLVEPSREAPAPWIVVASPRIEAPRAQPGRVLVWISQDAVRADHLSAYGYRRRTSPHFDRLSPEWVVFEDAMATSSWTLPSLASQFTSRYPLFHGATGESRPRDERHRTVLEVLAGAGFTVLGVTANDFVSSHFGMAHGFDVLRFTGGTEGPEGRQRAEDLNRLALDTLREWPGGDLALFVHYMDAHYPYDPPPPFDRLFPADGSDAEAGGSGLSAKVEAAYDGEIAYTDLQIDLLLKGARWPRPPPRCRDRLHGGPRGGIPRPRRMEALPHAVRRDAARTPRPPPAGNRRAPGGGYRLARRPRPHDSRCVRRAAPPSFQGRSLLPLARGERLPPREVFAETERNPDRSHRVAVQLGSVKYILRTRNGSPEQRLSEELYDLASDPRERRSDLTHPQAERLRRDATAYLLRGRAEARTPAAVDAPPELKARLRALGYLP